MTIDNIVRSMLPPTAMPASSTDSRIGEADASERPTIDRPSIFDRMWSSINIKSIIAAVVYAGFTVGLAALWVFMPVVALPVTIALLSAVATKLANRAMSGVL